MLNNSSTKPNVQEMKELQGLFNAKKFNHLEVKTKELIKKYLNDANLHNILGVSLQAQDKLEDSIHAYEKAIELMPKFYFSYFNLGNVLKETLSPYEAEKNYKKCLKIKPDYIDAHISLGLILLDLNKLEESISTFKKALKIEPKNAILHRHLSEITKYSEKNSHMDEMEKIILDKNSNLEEQIHLSFALGKAYEDLRLYDNAFGYWEKGNSIKRKKINYASKNQIKLMQTIKDNFTKDLFKKFEYNKKSNNKLIFIVGMPRSGTTLVQQILSTHPAVFGLGETNQFSKTIDYYFFDKKNISINNLQHYDLKYFKEAGNKYLEKIRPLQKKNISCHILIKDPLNFRWIGFIKLIFPGAKIVNCIRNPLDNCMSLFKNFFIGGVDFSYDLVELGEYYNFYLNLMNFWKKNLPDYYINISYEELINNKKQEIEKLLNFCGLDWNENCMQFHKYVHTMSTGTNSIKVHQPLYKTSMQYWKKYEKQLKPLIEILKV